MEEPVPRYPTRKSLDALAIELNLEERIPYWGSMAGYSYTPGNPEDTQQYIDYYFKLNDEDKKFTLMEMILDSLADQPNEADFLGYWQSVKPILVKDYKIHEYTVHYWKQMTEEFVRSNIMTPLIQNLIIQMN